MKRIGRMFVLALVMAAMLLPGFGEAVAAQDASLCDDALAVWQDDGTALGKYAIVEFTGGAGSQIVLGYGDATLSGGSGNDVLCAWGSGNILDGGSGNDLLVAREGPVNTFRGGSGNDTMIGVEGDSFDGGSGRNETIRHDSLPGIAFSLEWHHIDIAGQIITRATLTGTGLQPGANLQLTAFWINGPATDALLPNAVDTEGNMDISLDAWESCQEIISIVFETIDRNGDPIQANNLPTCPVI